MSATGDFDQVAAHRFFAVDCFNRAWELIDRPERTPDERQEMLLLAAASVWHWTQRADCTPQNLSIGFWQLSRVQALLGDGAGALLSAERCWRESTGLAAFFRGYAHEAWARAAQVSGARDVMLEHLAAARALLPEITDDQERAMLERDLQSIA